MIQASYAIGLVGLFDVMWLLPAPPRSPAQFRLPAVFGIVFKIPRLCCPETRDSTVSVAGIG
jgi:hypothetical protein